MNNLQVKQSTLSQKGKGIKYSLNKEQFELQAMVVPFIILILIFSYIPMYGIIMAFQEYQLGDIIGGSKWVGVKYFKEFFLDNNFWHIMKNTFGISSLKLLFGFPAPIILAILFNEVKSGPFRKSVQTISYMPHFISWVVVSGLFFELLSSDGGIVNNILVNLNIIKDPIMFFGDPNYFWGITVISAIWKEVGFNSIIFIAAIAAIDTELYEAADIDGAGRFSKIWHITLAGIKSTIVIILILDISNIVNAGFEQIMPLTNNLKNQMIIESSEIIDTYVYKMGIQLWRYSYSTAVGIFKAVLSVALLTFANYFSRKVGEDSLW